MIKIVFTFLFLTLSLNTYAQSDKTTEILKNMESLSIEVKASDFREVRSEIRNSEMDLIIFRLTKEIEKVPEFNLGEKNYYDLSLIQALFDFIYERGTQYDIAQINKLKNLAGKKLFVFSLYSELLVYQLDAILLRGDIYLSGDDKAAERATAFLSRTNLYIQTYKSNYLNIESLSKSPTQYLEYMANACAGFF